ncbi:Hypothetical predicted protein [Paramuricea clavata]|uniref:Uncharacterized protein n=1 Tax=Paramuricea clavata TaxID=317549 RepID=A0A7D9HW86_PARCT|nr:Hypothetical predicted protein [Paramuricea clavata]
MEIQISGCVFSSLFLELANSQGDIEGFLLGEIEDRTTSTVSDSQDVSVKHHRIFAVQEIVVCQGLFSFYDGVGRIHVEKLDRILGKKKQVALGWFKFRRNTRLCVSMREKVIHRNLLEQFGIKDSENFVFSVFSSQHAKNLATHTFRYSAFYCPKHYNRVFNGVPIQIINLGNTAQTEYKQDIAATSSTSKQYQNVIGSFSDEFLDNVGQLQQVKHARSMYKNMLGKLKGLKEAVHKSESQLIGLSDNIEILKHQLEKAMQEKRLKPEDTTSEDDLILLDDKSEQDLMSFEDLETEDESSQEATKHVVVAKHIYTHTTQETNSAETSVNHTRPERTNYANEDGHRSYDHQRKSPQY